MRHRGRLRDDGEVGPNVFWLVDHQRNDINEVVWCRDDEFEWLFQRGMLL